MWEGARAFLDNFEKVEQLMPRVQRQVNDIKRKDQEIWDERQKNNRDCRAWAECMKLDPSMCDPASTDRAPQ